MVGGAVWRVSTSRRLAIQLFSHACRGLCQKAVPQGWRHGSSHPSEISLWQAVRSKSHLAGSLAQESLEDEVKVEAGARKDSVLEAKDLKVSKDTLRVGVIKGAVRGMSRAFETRKEAAFESYYNDYKVMGGQPQTWIFGARMSLCFKAGSSKAKAREELKAGLFILKELLEAKLPHSARIYSILISGCGKAERPDVAEVLFAQMEALGIKGTTFVYNNIIDVMSRSGDMKKAEQYLQRMLAARIKPNVVTFNVMISGPASRGEVAEVQRIMKELMPAHGIRPNTITFNSLIHTHTRAADADGAYGAWQAMKDAGCMPDGITRTALMAAFRDSPVLPIGLWKEVNEIAMRGEWEGEGNRAAGRALQAKQRYQELNRWNLSSDLEVEVPQSDASSISGELPHTMFDGRGFRDSARCIDLHGFSVVESRILVMEHLNDLARRRLQNPVGRQLGLHIITGVGNNSRMDNGAGAVVREAVLEQLNAVRVPFIIAENKGVVCVSAATVWDYARRSQKMEENVKWYQNIVMRYSIVGGGIAVACIVPSLWALTTGSLTP